MSRQRARQPAKDVKSGSSEPLIQRIPTSRPVKDTLPADEQARLLSQQGGLMQRAREREKELQRQQQEQQISTAQYVWQAIFLAIPFGFLLGAFDVTVKVQYDEPWDVASLLLRSAKAIPALLPVVYLSNRHKNKKLTQVAMALGNVVVGSFLMYTLKHSPSLGQMLRAPGLATIWVYFTVQLDLLPAVLSLAIVGIYWYFGLSDGR